MKKIYTIFGLIMMATFAFIACQQEEDIPISTLKCESEVITPLYYTADVTCVLNCTASSFKAAYVQYAQHPDFNNYQQKQLSMFKDGGTAKCIATLANLEPDSTYYVRYVVSNGVSSLHTEVYSQFRTLEIGVPELVTMLDSTSVNYDKARIIGKIILDGGLVITECGVVYGLTDSVDIDDNCIPLKQYTDSFSHIILDLKPMTTYYARVYAKNAMGVGYGDIVSFTTTSTTPELDSLIVDSITSYTATIHAEVLSDGGEAVMERGIYYRESSTILPPSIESADSVIVVEGEVGEFACQLTNLKPNTVYAVAAYATNVNGIAYGPPYIFTTDRGIATVTTTAATNVSYTSATVGGIVTNDGGATVTERGVVYATTQNPTTENNKIVSGSDTGLFSCNLTDLQDGTTYYVRAYAINEKGTAYGEEISFTTVVYGMPVINTISATNIFNTSAVVGGNITEDGGAVVMERGVCYSTSSNPTTSDTKLTNGTGTGSFYCTLSDLQPGTTYYARAYLINTKGTTYGEVISFTTMTTLHFPMTTTPATEITCTTAEVGGNITGDGGSAITERGVCYGTSPSPTMSDMTIQKGRGVGIFTCTLTDLQDGVTYYVRAYGVNTLGISYGDEISFTTIKKSLPTITIIDPNMYSTDDATIEAEVVDDGCLDVTTRGVCYSTSPNPSITDKKVANGEGIGTFSCLLSNLQEATTYYVRAYAENEKGVAYSDEKSFTTRSRTYHDGYEYVDLGLSVMWATHNVGTTTPEGAGDYFAWGEVEPKELYDWSTYEYCGGTENSISKYCTSSNYGVVDHKNYLEPIDDAAQANWGGDWRMPTRDEMQELMNQCTWEITSYNGSGRGYKITSKINGNTIFMPSNTGYKDGSSTTYSGSFGYFYSSSLRSSTSAYYIDCGNSNTNIHLYDTYRYYGRTVRPVWREKELPMVTTGTWSDWGYNIIVINSCNVITIGSAPVTEYGIVYCTLPNPPISDTKVPVGSGKGTFSCTLSNLQEGLTYYARAYAVNQAGVAYGEEVSFTPTGISNESGLQKFGWEDKNAMFQDCMADCGVTGLDDLYVIRSSGNNEAPLTNICSKLIDVSGMMALEKWDWLEAYIMQVQNADPNATPLTEGVASAAWRYALAAFFIEGQRTGWPRSADFSQAGRVEAFLPFLEEYY